MSSRDPLSDQGRLLLNLARDVSSSLDLQEVLDKSFTALEELVGFSGGAIQLIQDGHLKAAAAIPDLSEEAKLVRIPLGTGISGTIAVTGEPVYIPDITVDERVSPQARAQGTSGGVRSYFGAPLIVYGRPIGVFQIDSTEADAFPPDVQERVLMFLPTIAAAVSNALMFDAERSAVEKLLEAEAIKSRFMQIVSHELRTPLAVVMGFSETLVAKVHGLERDQIKLAAERTHAGALRLERLIGDLVSVAQAERGVLSVEVKPSSVASIIDQVTFEVGTPSHKIEVELEPELPDILVDQDRTIQALDNLVVNARKFSAPGTAIQIRAVRDGDTVAISVADKGKGIAPADIDRIFDPFFQVDQSSTRAVGGLGIGLYLVKQFCIAMNADIAVDSSLKEGTTFTLKLPVAE